MQFSHNLWKSFHRYSGLQKNFYLQEIFFPDENKQQKG